MVSYYSVNKKLMFTICLLAFPCFVAAQSEAEAESVVEGFSRKLENIDVEASRTRVEVKSDGLTDLAPVPVASEDDNIRRLYRDSMHYAGGGFHIRYRKGEEGLDKLVETRMPVEMNFNVGLGRASFELTPVYLSSGELSSSQYKNRYFATNGLYDPDDRVDGADSNNQGGVSFGVTYEIGGFSLNAGTTPVGFAQSNGVGEFSFDHAFGGGFNFGVSAFRKPVTDSVLSYAGLEDELSGETWGAIIRNGGSFRLGYDAGGFGVYSDFISAIYSGENVPDNDYFQYTGGIYFIPYRGESLQISGGFNITYFEFEKNLRFFTFGQGGYFSPELFYSASIPFSLTYTQERISLSVDLTVGFQYFSEESADFYPYEPSLQAQLESLELTQPVAFEGQTQTKFANKIGVRLDYFLTDNFSARARLESQSAADYEESVFGVDMEYRF
ncbi:cellulose synthase subunit BcsC-related outer membrane protein [Microbulbifer sp. CAU 1566]|uniref:cellulose synthase subunit BcsC-related outer membrane protein n=1 Tax=Microbulbifer sp. CAU 1566 TaxID=2933269 RepID=UPI002004D528|nr:cellulose synthase subunit BcsC-related outer membrane protein [Microbulbifer sp. CAU 1566]MCK7595721.1 cellulose synthase subunit BcsC-related outer membrane protein [Microbulbifer sp. CAU 1566]